MTTELGEQLLKSSDLAKQLGADLAAVDRSLEGRVVCATTGSPVRLARAAAEGCLARANCVPETVDGLVWLGEQVEGLRLQQELSLEKAFLLCIAGDCAEYLSALVVADGLLLSGSKNILVCAAERFPNRLTDTPPDRQNYRNFLGDAGSAMFVTRGRPGVEMLGFGFATRGSDWQYLQRIEELRDGRISASELPYFGSVFRETLPTARTALARCLQSGGVDVDSIDHICLPSIRPRRLLLPLIRLLGLPQDRLRAHPTYSHLGKSDIPLDLEFLMEIAGPGETALIFASGIGVMRSVLVRF